MEAVPSKRRKRSSTPGRTNRPENVHRFAKYITEEERLKSFKKWPIPDIKTPEELAKAGFIYEGKGDLVKCFSCGGGHTDWQKNEDPCFEHAKFYPQCAFTIEQRGENYVNTVRQSIKESYITVESRISSFNEFWPHSAAKAPKELAEAGFFYTGYTDEVLCFQCGVIINNWKVDDVAWFKHVKRNSSCKFALDIKGQAYLHKAKRVSLSSGKEYNEELIKTRMNPNQPIHKDYESIEKRIESFKKWPKPNIKKPEELAEVGFFYLGKSDYVKCYHCSGDHFTWLVTEDPAEEHARWFPACPLISKIKGETFVEEVRKKWREAYGTTESRKESFKNWPQKANKTPEELCEAGFFSTNNEDQVQCFECGYWHIDWRINEDPWFKHAELNPSCKFVQKIKGEIFVNKVEQVLASRKEILWKNRKKIIDSDDSSDTDDDEIKALMNSSTVQTVLNKGFNELRIKRAFRNHLKRRKSFENVVELFAVIMESQKQDPIVTACLENIEKENNLLMETKVCGSCDKQGPIMIYVPCGHLHSCCACVGDNPKHCIACKVEIEHKLEMFPKTK